MDGPHTGYWGDVTCLGDSAEPNYAVTWYIGEFWATLSCCLWIVLSVLLVCKNNNLDLWITTLMHLFAGIGGIFYHVTLGFWSQLFDRAAVLCWMAATTYRALRLRNSSEKWELELPRDSTVVVALAPFMGVLCYHDSNVPLFVLLVGVCTYNFFRLCSVYPSEAVVCRVALKLSAVALAFFLLDELQPLGFAYCHVVWHFGAAVATFMTTLFLGIVENKHKRTSLHLQTFHGLPIWYKSELCPG